MGENKPTTKLLRQRRMGQPHTSITPTHPHSSSPMPLSQLRPWSCLTCTLITSGSILLASDPSSKTVRIGPLLKDLHCLLLLISSSPTSLAWSNLFLEVSPTMPQHSQHCSHTEFLKASHVFLQPITLCFLSSHQTMTLSWQILLHCSMLLSHVWWSLPDTSSEPAFTAPCSSQITRDRVPVIMFTYLLLWAFSREVAFTHISTPQYIA